MRRESASERQAWTAHVEGREVSKPNKYGAVRTGKYASKYECEVAGKLAALESAGVISDLREQVKFTLIPGQGKLRPIVYIADWTYLQDGVLVVADAKGFRKDKVYRLKKKMLQLLHNATITEL